MSEQYELEINLDNYTNQILGFLSNISNKTKAEFVEEILERELKNIIGEIQDLL